MEKLKVDIFDGPQIRELMKDQMFDQALIEDELSARQSLKSIITNILGNQENAEYEKKIDGLLKNFCQLRTRISVKLHLDYFLKNCGNLSEE